MNKKYYININTELNIYQIIEYCYNRLAIVAWIEIICLHLHLGIIRAFFCIKQKKCATLAIHVHVKQLLYNPTVVEVPVTKLQTSHECNNELLCMQNELKYCRKNCVNEQILVKVCHEKIEQMSKLARMMCLSGTFLRRYYQFCQLLKFFRIIQFVFHMIDAYFCIFTPKFCIHVICQFFQTLSNDHKFHHNQYIIFSD